MINGSVFKNPNQKFSNIEKVYLAEQEKEDKDKKIKDRIRKL